MYPALVTTLSPLLPGSQIVGTCVASGCFGQFEQYTKCNSYPFAPAAPVARAAHSVA